MINKRLVESISKAANIIHESNIKGAANFVVVNQEIAEFFNNYFKKEQRIKKLKNILDEK